MNEESSNYIKKTNLFFKKLNNDLISDFYAYESLDSTNEKLKELARNGGKEGTVVITQKQVNGRGRFNRTWESPVGGLYFSILLRPKKNIEKATLLSLVTSVAISKTLGDIGTKSTIKWPNDVKINGKKVAGILIESESLGKNLNFITLGIGINLNTDICKFSKDILKISTSVSSELKTNVDYFHFFELLLNNIKTYYEYFLKNDFNKIIADWKELNETIGKKVIIENKNEKIQGFAVDISPDGFLQLMLKNGDKITITSGDCFYIKN